MYNELKLLIISIIKSFRYYYQIWSFFNLTIRSSSHKEKVYNQLIKDYFFWVSKYNHTVDYCGDIGIEESVEINMSLVKIGFFIEKEIYTEDKINKDLESV